MLTYGFEDGKECTRSGIAIVDELDIVGNDFNTTLSSRRKELKECIRECWLDFSCQGMCD
jgi:hypothetical protein